VSVVAVVMLVAIWCGVVINGVGGGGGSDGHGGGEVAKYTKNHFETLLREIPEYKSFDY